MGNNLKLDDQSKQKISNIFSNYGKLLHDETISYKKRKKIEKKFYKNLDLFRENISSFLSEFMLAGLVKIEGYESQFILTEESKTCGLMFNSLKTEIKTILDRNRSENRIEEDLEQELNLTLKRSKILNHINDALETNAQIVFINLTFSSLGLRFAKFVFNKAKDFSVHKALRKSILFADQIKTNNLINVIPVVIFSTLINSIKKNINFFHLHFYIL